MSGPDLGWYEWTEKNTLKKWTKEEDPIDAIEGERRRSQFFLHQEVPFQYFRTEQNKAILKYFSHIQLSVETDTVKISDIEFKIYILKLDNVENEDKIRNKVGWSKIIV